MVDETCQRRVRKKDTGRGRKEQNKEGVGGKTEQRLSKRKGIFLSLPFFDIILSDFILLPHCVGRSEVGKLHGEEGVNLLVLPSRFPCLDDACNAWQEARNSVNGFTK